jgi:ACS family glucarate transporter-like MFS transporter
MYPSSNRLVSRWIPIRERGKANGFIFAGVGAGAGVAPPLITYIMTQYGWRVSFVISAVIGVAAGLVWYVLARDEPGQHPSVDNEEAAYIREGIATSGNAGAGERLSWGTIFGSRNVLLLTFSYASFGYTAYIFFTWFFIYLNQVRGLDLKSSALYSILPFLSMAAGSIIGGWVSDRVTKHYGRWAGRCLVGAVAMALSATLVALATQVADARVASVVLAGGAFGIYLAQSSFWSVSADIGTRSAGSLSGVMNMGNQLAGAVTASLTPWIGGQFGWSASFQVAAAFCAAGAVAWLLVNPEIQLGSPATDARPVGANASAIAR